MTEKVIQKDPEALREAKFADLLLMPFSEEAKNFEQDLTHMTVSFLLKNGYRERRLKSDALIRFKATISALIGDLLVAALNEASKKDFVTDPVKKLSTLSRLRSNVPIRALLQNGFVTTEVDVGGCDVVDALAPLGDASITCRSKGSAGGCNGRRMLRSGPQDHPLPGSTCTACVRGGRK